MAQPIDNVPLLDVTRGNQSVQDEIQAAIVRVIASGRFVYGPDCQQLEAEIAALCQCKFGIGCASGSDALLLALMAIGIEPDDEVILPSFTFFATGSAIVRLGARPVFVDIEPDTLNIDTRQIQAAITPKTKAIIPVHLFGQCAAMEVIQSIAADHNLLVVEDAAQAVAASRHNRPAAGWGDLGCFSFYPTKNLGAFGDGGMIVTNDEDLAKQIRLIANHGMQPRYHHQIVGINSRLDSLQAAVLRIKLTQLEQWNQQRHTNAQRYFSLLSDAQLDSHVQLPVALDDSVHVWNQFTIRVANQQRDALREHLQSNGIGTEIYYPIPIHQQPCFQEYAASVSLPVTEAAAAEVLSLPIFPELTAAEQERVVETIRGYFATRQAAA